VALLDAAVDPRRPNQIDRHVGAVSTLAALEGVTGEADAAFANQEKAMRLAAAYLPERSHTVSTLQHNYAHGLTRRGRHREAEAVYRSALNRTVETLGPDHPDVGITLGKLGEIRNLPGGESVVLEMDGGINRSTVGKCTEAGCQLLVAGSAVFKSESGTDYSAAIESLMSEVSL
jgi:hypothetical protein